MEQFPQARYEKPEETRRKINAVIENLRSNGYEFDFKETSDEFVITLRDGRETHLPAWKVLPVEEKGGEDPVNYDIEEVIRACVVYPEKKVHEAVHLLKKEDSRRNL